MFKIWLLVLLISGCNAERDEETQMQMVIDVIKSSLRPTAVSATVCWSPRQKMQFVSSITANVGTKISSVEFIDITIRPIIHSTEHHVMFVFDISCNKVPDYFNMTKQQKLFRFPYRWMFFDSSTNIEDGPNVIPPALNNIEPLPDSEVIVVRRSTNNTFHLHLVYKVAAGFPWKTDLFGTWDPEKRLQKPSFIDIDAISIRRLNLDKITIPICYVVIFNDSINHMEDRKDDHIDTITKANYLTSLHIMDFLNATRESVFVNTWGYNTNGTWNGLTGHLLKDQVEIGGTPMFFTSERASIVEYITSPTLTRSKFVFLQPKLSYENNLFLLPFRTNVWYCSAALLFLIFLVLLLVTAWEWKKDKHDPPAWTNKIPNKHQIKKTLKTLKNKYLLQLTRRVFIDPPRKRFRLLSSCSDEDIFLFVDRSDITSNTMEPGVLRANIVDVAVLTLGATCQQGSPVELKGSLGRVVMLVLFLALMFLYTSYSANIVALLQSSSSQIHTLEDLLHSRLKFGVLDTVYNRYYFSTATDPTRKAIYTTKVAPPGTQPRFMSMEEGVLNIQKGLFAFHMETDVGYKFVGKFFHEGEKCGLKEIQYLQVVDPWLAVRKNSPYKEMFKIGFKRLIEHELQARENLMFYQKKPRCTNRGANFVSVSMVDCYPAVLVLTYGALLSLGLLVLEILVYRRKEIIKRSHCVRKLSED